MRCLILTLLVMVICACDNVDSSTVPAVRGLKTHLVQETEQTSVRHFPSVLEPSELNSLSFEVAGKLGQVTVNVGQRVEAGEIIAQLDPLTLQLQVENAAAGVRAAETTAKNAQENLTRQETLLESGAISRAAIDDARTDTEAKFAQLEQARKSLESAQDTLTKAVLLAPFDGIINSVDIDSYSTVGVGTPIATLYSPDLFEVSFSVNFEVVSRLVVGTPASIRLADRPEIELEAVVSELGSRADAVSSFPIVLTLLQSNPILKAGMAVQASIEFPLLVDEGFVVPISVSINDGEFEGTDVRQAPSPLAVYVYNEATSTVQKRQVMVGGLRENSLLIIEGLNAGDRIASAGVSFLRDGQEVKLLDDEE